MPLENRKSADAKGAGNRLRDTEHHQREGLRELRNDAGSVSRWHVVAIRSASRRKPL
jgi:hypothetical protein